MYGVGKVSRGLLDSSTKGVGQVNERLWYIAAAQRLISIGWLLWLVGERRSVALLEASPWLRLRCEDDGGRLWERKATREPTGRRLQC